MVFIQSTDTAGLERAFRLFPIRTGIAVPDWVVIGSHADRIGAAGILGAGYVLVSILTCSPSDRFLVSGTTTGVGMRQCLGYSRELLCTFIYDIYLYLYTQSYRKDPL